MHRNFFVAGEVPELGRAKSYAVRLFDYGGAGRDQIAWVVERLRADPECRDAAITTFQPLTDTTYIPCVSLLDFWLRDGSVELIVYAHSLDFGKKAYGNLVELARLQEHVAGELDAGVGRLVIHVKTAHIYEPEWAAMAELTAPRPPRTLAERHRKRRSPTTRAAPRAPAPAPTASSRPSSSAASPRIASLTFSSSSP